jgi:hypothetical protein
MAISKITARALNDAPQALDQSSYNGTGALIPPSGTTAQRPSSPVNGSLRYNSTISVLEQYTTDQGWVGIEPAPTLASIAYPGTQTAVFSGDTVTINGTGFKSGTVAKFYNPSNGITTTADSTTRISSTQLAAVFPAAVSTEGTYSVTVNNPSGLGATLDSILVVDGNPVWSTSAGSLGSFIEQTAMTTTIAAVEDGSAITSFTLLTGSLPSGVSLNTSTGVISGTPAAVAGDTTYSFTIRAKDVENQITDRAFSILVSNNTAPVWISASGSLGSTTNDFVMSPITLSADDGDASYVQTVTYSVTSGSLPTGMSLNSSTGVITGTPTGYNNSDTTVSFTVTASDGIDTTSRAFSITVIASDPYYRYVSLLADGQGTNNATSTTIVDTAQSLSFTNTNSPYIGNFSPFSPNGWSVNFGDDTSACIYGPSTASYNIGTGNFTIEFWLKSFDWSGNQRCMIQGQTGTSAVEITNGDTGNKLNVNYTGQSPISYSWTPNLGQWYHIAVVRTGTGASGLALYIDGAQVATGSGNFNIGQYNHFVGGLNWATGYNLRGHISDYRFSNIARYTGSSFSVPTTWLTSDANTCLLTCANNRVADKSPNGSNVTTVGVPVFINMGPYKPTAFWDATTHGGSYHGRGTTADYSVVTTGTNTLSGDFTIEAWIYPRDYGRYARIVSGGGNGTHRWTIGFANTWGGHGLIINYYNGTDYYSSDIPTTTQAGAPLYQWTHIAVVRTGSTVYHYINGNLYGTISVSGDQGTTDGFTLFARQGALTECINGYVSGVRVVSGANLYGTGSNITVPSAPPTTAGSGTTRLLMNFTNAGPRDKTGKHDIQTVGGSKISTGAYKWGSSALYNDGVSGSRFVIPKYSTGDLYLNGAFTVEGWFNANSIANGSYQRLWAFGTFSNANSFDVEWNANPGPAVVFRINFNGIVNGASGSDSATGLVSAGSWYHIAVTRDTSGTIRGFLNGTLTQTLTGAQTAKVNLSQDVYISSLHGYETTQAAIFGGYINDFRITNGIARYTSSFTAPTATFPQK